MSSSDSLPLALGTLEPAAVWPRVRGHLSRASPPPLITANSLVLPLFPPARSSQVLGQTVARWCRVCFCGAAAPPCSLHLPSLPPARPRVLRPHVLGDACPVSHVMAY